MDYRASYLRQWRNYWQLVDMLGRTQHICLGNPAKYLREWNKMCMQYVPASVI